MKTVSQSTLGLVVLIAGVPSSAQEYDEMAKEVGACVEDACDNVIYRSWLANFRPKLAEALNAKFGSTLAWNFKEETTPKGAVKKIYDKETTYLGLLKEALTTSLGGEQAALDAIQDVATEVAARFPFTLERTRTGGKISAEHLASADSLIETIEAAGGDYTRFMSNIKAKLPSYVFAIDESTSNPTRESVALAIRGVQEQAIRAAKESALASLS